MLKASFNMYQRYTLEFQSFKGFDLQLFHDSGINKTTKFGFLTELTFIECSHRFYIGDKQMKSCQDFYDLAQNYSTPSSIFNIANILYEANQLNLQTFRLNLQDESKYKLCPLALKNVMIGRLFLNGENSFFSRRIVKFSNETFADLNTTITELHIDIGNVEVDFELVHPSIFIETNLISISSKIKSIHPDLFVKLKKMKKIELETTEFRSFMHQHGIEWIKNINRDLNVNLSDPIQVNECYENKCAVLISFSCSPTTSDLQMYNVFPEEDFCIYKDFPFKQIVIIIQRIFSPNFYYKCNPKLSCTFLWLIQYYNLFEYYQDFLMSAVKFFMISDEFKSMSKCNFTHRISMCNKSDFEIKPIISYYDIGQSILLMKYIINITSYLLSIFGFVTNLLVIITISSKKNQAEFKDFNQYKFMRISSICSCLLFSIHFLSWLTECNYPYGIFFRR